MHLKKSLRIPNIIAVLCGFLLIVMALPAFYRFTVTAIENEHLSNTFAGVTGVIVSLIGLPLIVIGLRHRRLLDMVERIEDCTAGRWFFGTLIIIAPGQLAWYLFHEAYLPRCSGGPSGFSFLHCFPVFSLMVLCGGFAIVMFGHIVAAYLINSSSHSNKQSP